MEVESRWTVGKNLLIVDIQPGPGTGWPAELWARSEESENAWWLACVPEYTKNLETLDW